jgi:hypothetical protein
MRPALPYFFASCQCAPLSGAIYHRALTAGAVNCRVFLMRAGRPMPGLLQRPGDWTIGRAIGRGVYELIAARVQLAGNRALVGFPAKIPCPVEQSTYGRLVDGGA